MDPVTSDCRPLCAQVGHTYVTMTAIRCDHHGLLTIRIARYSELDGEINDYSEREYPCGPFTTDTDVQRAMTVLIEALQDITEP